MLSEISGFFTGAAANANPAGHDELKDFNRPAGMRAHNGRALEKLHMTLFRGVFLVTHKGVVSEDILHPFRPPAIAQFSPCICLRSAVGTGLVCMGKVEISEAEEPSGFNVGKDG